MQPRFRICPSVFCKETAPVVNPLLILVLNKSLYKIHSSYEKSCYSKPNTEKKSEPLLISSLWKQIFSYIRPAPQHLQEQVGLHMAPDLVRLQQETLCISFPCVPHTYMFPIPTLHTLGSLPLRETFLYHYKCDVHESDQLVPDKIILQQESYCILFSHCLWR